ncbi:MAG: hypothetical protein ACPGSI_16450 [Pikeienuella sp.]
MNGFEQHGIDHVSASSLNTYAAEPALWVMERLLKKRGPVGCAAYRGRAIEHGVSLGLFAPEMEVEACQDSALKEYDRETALNGDHNRQKERDAIPGAVEIALAELRQYGVPDRPNNERQHKVSIDLEGVAVPCIGFTDFEYPQHGMLIELKTQLRLASSISVAHARQVSVYQAAKGNWQARVAYVTPKKVGVYVLEQEQCREGINSLTQTAIRLERFLRLSKDPEELAGLVVPNYDHFFWSSPVSRALGRETFGM